MPPEKVALTRLPAAHLGNAGSLRVLPDRDPAASTQKIAFAEWRAVPSGGVEVLWGNGFTGVRFVLRDVSGGLEGTAETFSDAPGGVHRSTVRADPVSCTM